MNNYLRQTAAQSASLPSSSPDDQPMAIYHVAICEAAAALMLLSLFADSSSENSIVSTAYYSIFAGCFVANLLLFHLSLVGILVGRNLPPIVSGNVPRLRWVAMNTLLAAAALRALARRYA